MGMGLGVTWLLGKGNFGWRPGARTAYTQGDHTVLGGTSVHLVVSFHRGPRGPKRASESPKSWTELKHESEACQCSPPLHTM